MLKRLNLFKDMPIGLKLGTIVLLMFIPMLSLLYSFVSTKQESIAFAEKELLGTDYLIPLRNLIDHVQQHRGLAGAYLEGAQDQKERAVNLEALIDNDFKTLFTLTEQLGKTLETKTKLPALMQSWQTLKQGTMSMKPGESFDRHTQLVAEILGFVKHVGDRSNLILDPDLDTYYLMDTVVNRLPDTMEHLAKLSGQGSAIAARKLLTLEEQVQMRVLANQAKQDMGSLVHGLQVAYKERSGLEQKLGPSMSATVNSVDAFLKLTLERLVNVDTVKISTSEFFYERFRDSGQREHPL